MKQNTNNNFYNRVLSQDEVRRIEDTASNWQILNVQVKCDVCKMDNPLENEFAQRFLSGQTIPINYNTFITNLQVLSGQTPSVNITRALSRLKSVYFNTYWSTSRNNKFK